MAELLDVSIHTSRREFHRRQSLFSAFYIFRRRQSYIIDSVTINIIRLRSFVDFLEKNPGKKEASILNDRSPVANRWTADSLHSFIFLRMQLKK